jgi:hypothetical protein
MSIDLTNDEIYNLILVTIDQIQGNLSYPENGVELTFLASNLDMKLDELKKCIQELRLKKLVSWHFEKTRGGQFFVNPTEKTLEYLEKMNSLTIHETAKIILEKSYDFYKRGEYDNSMQLDSSLIGSIAGFSNITKVQSVIELLEDEGYIKNPAIMHGNTIYFLSARGIGMIETKTENQTMSISPVTINNYIDNKNGNVAINSNNVEQIINYKELTGYLDKLEKLITENLIDKEKKDALDDLETMKELVKSDSPKKHLIQRMLNNLDKIPILIEVVKQIREFMN